MTTALIPQPTPNTDHNEDTAMTATTTATGPVTTTRALSETKATFGGAVVGEWIKFRSVRSTVWTLIAAGISIVAFGVIFSATAGSGVSGPGPGAQLTDPVSLALGAVDLAQLIVGVLGVLVVATEYSTGLIRTSVATVGRRLRLLVGKITVLGAATAVTSAVSVTLAAWLGQAVYAGDLATVAISELGDVILGATVYLTGIALIGAALGFIFRSTAAGIGVLMGGIFIGPNLLSLLPDGFSDVVLKYLPSNAGSAMMGDVSNVELLSTGAAYTVFIAWVIGLLALAGATLRNRDA